MARTDSILIVDDDDEIRKQLFWALKDEYEVSQAADGEQALRVVGERATDLVLLDLRFPPDLTEITGGKRILEALQKVRPDLPVIIMTGDRDRETAVEMVARGAFDLFRKPIDLDDLRVIVRRGLRMRRLEQEVRQLRSRLQADHGIENLVGKSPPMREMVRLVRKVADTNATVLITGESGTGKELVARALHQLSSRREELFVALNCTSVPGGLIDDELFGHESGAFTGAAGRRRSKFEFATGGTLFLDEVGDLPSNVQVKLLRVLQESEVQRLGSNQTIRVDVRLVAATHQDLEHACSEGGFREDLYYRLKVVEIHVPPLRERVGDVALLAEHFLEKYAQPGSPRSIAPEALQLLSAHDWPGNVRQLENLINAIAVTCESSAIKPADLPGEIRDTTRPPIPVAAGFDLQAMERQLIQRALDRTSGNRTRAAKLLGISRHVLLNKLKRHRLDS